MPIERIKLPDDREQWLAERRAFVNASEMAIVCGEGAWGSLAELYAEKKGLRAPLLDDGIMRRGRWGEGAVFEALAEERPEWTVLRARLHVRDTDRRIACTPDGFATRPDRLGPGVVQAKVVSRSIFKQKWLDDPSDDVGIATPPAHYRIQTITEMMLNRSLWGVLAVLINGEFDWHFRLIEVDRDDEIEQRIVENTAAFFRDYLDPEIMPPFEPQRDEALIKALYPKDSGATIDLTSDNRALVAVEDLVQTQAALSRLRAQEKTLKTELEGKLGAATFGVLRDGRCLSWRRHHRKGYSVAASDYRVFRVLQQKPQTEEQSHD